MLYSFGLLDLYEFQPQPITVTLHRDIDFLFMQDLTQRILAPVIIFFPSRVVLAEYVERNV